MRLVVRDLTKEFVVEQGRRPASIRKVAALAGVNLEVREGEFFGIIGPTGCGKTTLLNIIAGLEKPTSGSVEFVGERRAKALVSMVFQDASLMPWRTVERNVPLGPEFRKEPAPLYKRATRFFLEMVRMLDFRGVHPTELSGGMRQKAALARALANDPEMILMDEPFANLDAQTRLVLREEVSRVWEREKKTIILVTHNLEEAVMLCDRVAVMSAAPGTVKSVQPVDVGRPRSLRSMSDPAFTDCLQKIWDLLRQEVERGMRQGARASGRQAPTNYGEWRDQQPRKS
ncbi:MAG TPA: ABC transporter ATP-binding protein [Candidatus Acidoferrales bacterium]|nr:ABC transporter ATP-binding protein [Candidatus Acidoferrales bacterium]